MNFQRRKKTSPLVAPVVVAEEEGRSGKGTNAELNVAHRPHPGKARDEIEGTGMTMTDSWFNGVTRICAQGGIVIRS